MAATFALLGASPSAAGPNCDDGYHCVFYLDVNSARQSFFNSDPDFSNDTFDEFNVSGNGLNRSVNNNVYSASNSSTGNYESHYWDNTNATGFLFCLNPGHYVNSASTVDQPGRQSGDPLPSGLRDRASRLTLPGRTSTDCF
ncbi:hypothetical protein ACIP2X_07270 [Streptomyces sp. NPDC089424]|uniref:hypothetical protein n=1 Tax=Streptomyces sp. NPDC089424 TaxID=3365917 RepID=UPI00382E35B4